MKQKLFFFAFVVYITYTPAFAQPVIKTQRDFGGNGEDYFRSMTLTLNGGYFLGGLSYSNSSGEKSENSRGGSDYWIVSLDSSHNIVEDRTIGGNNEDVLTSLQQTNDGGYLLGGYSFSDISGEKTENNKGAFYTYDYWIIKLDSSRYIQWDKTVGGNDMDYLWSLQQTTDGGYILGGSSISNISSDKTEKGRGGFDYWVVKIDDKGKIKWDKTIGGNDIDWLNSLRQSTDGGYLLGGYSSSNASGEKTESSRGFNDYWLVKIDSLGNVQWDKTIGGDNDDRLNTFQLSSDGGYILGGYSFSNISGEKTENSRGSADYWVVKIDGFGNVQWDKTIGGNNFDELQCIQQTGDNGHILSGFSSSNISGEKTEDSRGSDDYWIIKLNKRGEKQWDKTIGGDSDDGGALSPVVVKEIARNRYVVGGSSWSKTTGDKKRLSRGSSDYWLVGLFYKTGHHELTTESKNVCRNKVQINTTVNLFTVYPNPTKDILHIQSNETATISLTNQSGKVLLTKTIQGNSTIDVSKFSAGLYYVKNNSTGAVQKVIITE